MFRISVVSMLGLVAVVAGCSEVHTPVDASVFSGGGGGGAQNVASNSGEGLRPVGIEATFLAISDSAPGFAGIYVGADRQTHLAVTSGASVNAVLTRLRNHYQGHAEEALLTDVTPTIVSYDYRELFAWKQALQARIRHENVSGVAVHVSTNSVDVFSEAAEGDRAAGVAAMAVGLPQRALRIIRAGPPEALADLKDGFTPLIPGGAGIAMRFPTDPGDTVGCTLGINVKLTYNAQEWNALTAAHCTATIGGGADNTLMSQGGTWPAYSSDYKIAHEIEDPAWTTSGCTVINGHQYGHCRYADMAVFRYYGDRIADSGYVAVTIKLDSMTTEWVSRDSTSYSAMGYWSDQPWEGVTLEHVGAKSGWHSASVSESCVDVDVGVPYYRDDYEWLCQTRLYGIADHGDSGGPVFSKGPGKRFWFAGLVSQYDSTDHSYYFISSFANICLDLGGCPTVVPL